MPLKSVYREHIKKKKPTHNKTIRPSIGPPQSKISIGRPENTWVRKRMRGMGKWRLEDLEGITRGSNR